MINHITQLVAKDIMLVCYYHFAAALPASIHVTTEL